MKSLCLCLALVACTNGAPSPSTAPAQPHPRLGSAIPNPPGTGFLVATEAGTAIFSGDAGQIAAFCDGGTPCTLPSFTATSGTASSRPDAGQTGNVYLSTDLGVASLDNASSLGWQNFFGGYFGTPPGPLSNWTVVGNVAAIQRGDAIVLKSWDGTHTQELLAPLPNGGATPWAVTLVGAWTTEGEQGGGGTYPHFGLVVSNGTTAGTSKALVFDQYQNNGSAGPPAYSNGVNVATLTTQTVNNIIAANDNRQEHSLFALRMLNDGTTYWYQWPVSVYANGLREWRTFSKSAVTTIVSDGLTAPTYFGAEIGTNSGGPTFASAVIYALYAETPATYPLTGVTYTTVDAGSFGSYFTYTTSTTIPFSSGSSVVVSGVNYSVTGTPSSPNEVLDGPIQVTGSNTFRTTTTGFSASGTVTYLDGGVVTLMSE